MEPADPSRSISAPTITGTGFISLDLVLTGPSPVLRAGGSCGNVLSILAYLGWRSTPVALFGDDRPAGRVLSDLEGSGVKICLVKRKAGWPTPLVLQIPAGVPGMTHRFVTRDPVTARKFPEYRALPPRVAAGAVRRIAAADFFYSDMSSRASVMLADACRELGAVFFFEPKSMRYPQTFRECLLNADIVKYSADEPVSRAVVSRSGAELVIETRGAGGLSFRSGNRWQRQPGFPVTGIVDTAGAGDWCSAGIIHSLRGQGRPWRRDLVEEALRFGQALGAMACRFSGARGLMYAVTRDEFRAGVRAMLEDGVWEPPEDRPASSRDEEAASLAAGLGIHTVQTAMPGEGRR